MNHLYCTGCQDHFGIDRKVPRVLPCLHGICDRCEGTSGQSVDCGKCNRKRFQRNTIKDDPVRKNELMVTLARRCPDRLLCTNKNDGKLASIFCLECLHLLCEDCQMAHSKVQTTTKHKCLSIRDLGRVAVSDWNTKLRCGKHPDYPLLFFCQDQLVCLYCVRRGQQQQPLEDIEDAFGKERSNLQILSERLARRIAQTQRHGPYATSNQNPKREIRDAFAKLRAAVRSRQIEISDFLFKKRGRKGEITFKSDIPRNLPDGDLNLLHYQILKNGHLTSGTGKLRFLSPNIQDLMNKLWYFGRVIDIKSGKDVNSPYAGRNMKPICGEMHRNYDQIPPAKSPYPDPRMTDGQGRGRNRDRNQGSDPSINPHYVEPTIQGGMKRNDPRLRENDPYGPAGPQSTEGRQRRLSYRDEPFVENPYYSEPLMNDSWGPQSMSPGCGSRDSLPTSSAYRDETIMPRTQSPQHSEAPISGSRDRAPMSLRDESCDAVPVSPPYKEEPIPSRSSYRDETIVPQTQTPQYSEAPASGSSDGAPLSLRDGTRDAVPVKPPYKEEPIVPLIQESQHSQPPMNDNRGSTPPDTDLQTPPQSLPGQSPTLSPDGKENMYPDTRPGNVPSEEGPHDTTRPFSPVPYNERPLEYQFPWHVLPRDPSMPQLQKGPQGKPRDPTKQIPTVAPENREKPVKDEVNAPSQSEPIPDQPDNTAQPPLEDTTNPDKDVPKDEPKAGTKPDEGTPKDESSANARPVEDTFKDEPLATNKPDIDTPKEEPSDNNKITTVVMLINMVTGTCTEIGRIQVLDDKLVPIDVSPGDIIGHLESPSGDVQELEITPSQYNGVLSRIICSSKDGGIYNLPIDFKGQRLPGGMQLEACGLIDVSRDAVIFVTEMTDMKITHDYIVLCPNMDDAVDRQFSDSDTANMSALAQSARDMGVRNYRGSVSGFPIDFEGFAYMEIWIEAVLRRKAEARTIVFEVGLASRAVIDSTHIMEGQVQAWGISISYSPELKTLCKSVWGGGEIFDHSPIKGHKIAQTMSFKFGILLNSQHHRLVIFDLERDDSFSVVPRVDFGMSLLPVWGACNYGNADVSIHCISGDVLQLGRLDTRLFVKAMKMSMSDEVM
ncbi:uncharacterized protein [Haliotis cracherodii]|uniref:uncharacterized protein n=1 Tax=Haliotis cracherodii TaxID=6455 RepID=UPI0039EBB23C